LLLFEPNVAEAAADLAQDIVPPPFFGRFGSESPRLALAGHGAGEALSSRTSAWSALVFGARRVFLAPPAAHARLREAEFGGGGARGGAIPMGESLASSLKPPAEWLRDVRPRVPAGSLFECTQQSGEILCAASPQRFRVPPGSSDTLFLPRPPRQIHSEALGRAHAARGRRPGRVG
jgi:hypothetical protein